MNAYRIAFLSCLLVFAACAGPRVRAHREGDLVHVTIAGEPFVSWHTAAEPRPFLFPVFGPGGVPMTRAFPIAERAGEQTDHPHHVSMWFAHGAVDGTDFWHGTARRERQVRFGGPEVIATATGVEVSCGYRWLVDDAIELCREERVLAFTEDAATGARCIDVDITLRPVGAERRFGDTKEGTFAVRVHETLRVEGKAATGHLLDSEGRVDGAVWGKRARWIDDRGVVDGAPVGIALFDHPDNFAHPTWWHARTYGLLAANPFGVSDFEKKPKGTGDLVVPEGGELRLRYRVLLHGDGWDRERLDAAWSAWCASTARARVIQLSEE
jgi:hypothetical protein